MDITVPIVRKNTINVAIPEKNTITVDIIRKNTISVAIDTPAIPIAPAFVSTEVGLINAYTIDMLFDRALNEAKIPDALDMIADFSGAPNEDLTTGLTWANNGFQTCVILGLNITSAIVDGSFARTINLFGLSGTLSNKYIRLIYNLTLNSGTVPYLKIEDALGATVSLAQLSQGLNIIEINTTGFNVSTLYCYLRNYGADNIPFATNFSLASFGMILLGTRLTGNVLSGLHVYSTSDRAITAGETGTIQYVPNALEAKKLQGTNGAKVVAFTESVTNNVAATIPVLQSITCADGYNIVHTYDLALDETSTPATSAYAFPGHTPTTVVVSGLTVTVTVTERIYWGDSDTSAYTKPATNMIKSTGGGEAASFTATAVTNNVVIDSNAQALINRMIAASETPVTARQVLINRTFVIGKTKAFWNKTDAVVTLAGHATLSARMNWLADQRNIVLVNAPTFEVDRGFTCATSGKYLKSSFNPFAGGCNFVQNSASIGLYSRTNVDESKEDISALAAVGDGILLDIRISNTMYIRLNDIFPNTADAGANTNSLGLHIVTREGANLIKAYKNGTKIIESTTASNTVRNVEIYIGCRNVNGTASIYTSKQYAFWITGSAFTQTDVNDIIEVFVTGYLTSIGANV